MKTSAIICMVICVSLNWGAFAICLIKIAKSGKKQA